MANSRIDTYLKKYKKLNDYRICYPIREKFINEEADESKKRDWQFRISIYPEKDNLFKAAQALGSVFQSEPDIEFKIISLYQGAEEFTLENFPWDGVQKPLGTEVDRDQRGKEFCVRMEYDSDTNHYIRTTEQWKDLMLRCWKALQDAEIEGIGYMTVPHGDLSISTELRITTPFSYTAFLPYAGHNGTLDQTLSDADREKKDDPLNGVIITQNDLEKYGIKNNHSEILEKRISYIEKHYKENKKIILEKLNNLKQESNSLNITVDSSIEEFNSFLDTYSPQNESFKNEANCQLDNISKLFPREFNSNLSETKLIGDTIGEIRRSIKSNQLDEQSIQKIKESIKKIKNVDNTDAFNQIQTDLQKYPDYTNDIALPDLQKMIRTFPAEMQLIYRHMSFLEKEKTALVKDIQDQKEININALKSFNEKIQSLEQGGNVTEEIVNKYKALSSTIINAKVDATATPYSTIAEHFSNEITNLINNPKPTPKQIKRSAEELDKKLYGKPPMTRTVKAAICGVIGALIGFAVGITVGAAVTSWAGGFGALPGAILGAVKGFTLGTAIGLGTAVVSAGVSGSFGFFSAMRNQDTFNAANAAINEAINPDVRASINAMKNII